MMKLTFHAVPLDEYRELTRQRRTLETALATYCEARGVDPTRYAFTQYLRTIIDWRVDDEAKSQTHTT